MASNRTFAMFAKQTVAAMLAAFVLVAAVGPVAAAGGQANSSITATVQMTDEATLITYEENNAAVTNAEMTIETVGEASFEGSGTYTTDENGTVELPAPDESTTVLLSVNRDTVQATATVDLQAPETEPVETTVSFDTDASSDDGSAQMAGSATGASGDDDVQADSGTDTQNDLSFVQRMLSVLVPGYDVVVESGAQAASGDVNADSSGDAAAQSDDTAASVEGEHAQTNGDAATAANGDIKTDQASDDDYMASDNGQSYEANSESSVSASSDQSSTEASGSGSGDVSDDVGVDLDATGTIHGDDD